MTHKADVAPLLERFFTQRLMQQRQASPHTISSYRDTFRQFLNFAQQRLARAPSRLSFEQIDAPLITAFLDELETRRGLSVRSRNLRLTAVHEPVPDIERTGNRWNIDAGAGVANLINPGGRRARPFKDPAVGRGDRTDSIAFLSG